MGFPGHDGGDGGSDGGGGGGGSNALSRLERALGSRKAKKWIHSFLTATLNWARRVIGQLCEDHDGFSNTENGSTIGLILYQ